MRPGIYLPDSRIFGWIGRWFIILLLLLPLTASIFRPASLPAPDVNRLDAQRLSQAAAAAPWAVFSPVDVSNLPMSANRLSNTGFENGSTGSADNWDPYSSGYTVDENGGRGSGRALRLVSSSTHTANAACQVITLNQDQATAVYIGGWSKTENLSGSADRDYSLYMDISFADGSNFYAYTIQFDTGSHDWQFREDFFLPAKPIRSISFYCMLRGDHIGTAWFDDLQVREVESRVVNFDSVTVVADPPASSPYGGASLPLASGDGLALALASEGGAITGVTVDGAPVQDAEQAYAGGFFVRDVASASDFVHVGGSLTRNGSIINHSGTITGLDLSFNAVYTASADRIAIHAELMDTTGGNRATTLYFALPVVAGGWDWGDDARSHRPIEGTEEFDNFRSYTGLGATGYVSKYPWASIGGASGGIALAVPLDSPRIMRLVHNPATNQFYAAFDLGISPQTSKFPSRASVDLTLYRFDGRWGFRAATQGYYDRFPKFFTRRIPPNQEGIWAAFSDLSVIPNVQDFGIAFHEIEGVDMVAFDDTANILSFRYLLTPWPHWLPLDEAIDPDNYDQVLAYLQSQYQGGDDQAEATLSSGAFDENGRYGYESIIKPWCNGDYGCVVFTVNPDPDINDATYSLNKARLEWNQSDQASYVTAPGLDGEYVDSFSSYATEMNFRAAHFAAADIPLTFRTGDLRVGIPQIFSNVEFARWLSQDVHDEMGKWMMGNGMLLDWPWGADSFDFMGAETNWVAGGQLIPESDAALLYRRILAYQRPYGLLMNTNFDRLSYAMVEEYFQICLLYGIYPSMFNQHDAGDPYWDTPSLYERDRELFRRYIPLIRGLNAAGWQPLTYATVSNSDVYIERFGEWPFIYFSLYNSSDEAVTVDVVLYVEELGLPPEENVTRTITVSLPPGGSRQIILAASSTYLPIIQR